MGKARAERSGGQAAGGRSLTFDPAALFAELAAKPLEPCEGITTAELRAQLGLSAPRATALITAALAAGKCRVVRKQLIARDGRRTNVPAYVFEG